MEVVKIQDDRHLQDDWERHTIRLEPFPRVAQPGQNLPGHRTNHGSKSREFGNDIPAVPTVRTSPRLSDALRIPIFAVVDHAAFDPANPQQISTVLVVVVFWILGILHIREGIEGVKREVLRGCVGSQCCVPELRHAA